MDKITVSTKGQIVLPKAVRDKRRWTAGTQLTVEETRDGVLLRSVERKKTRTLRDLVGSIRYKGPSRSVEEMNAAIEKEFRRRHARGRC